MKRSISSKPKAYNTFRNKILLAFIICSLVPLALLGFFSYNRSLTIAKDSIYRSAMYTSRQVGQLISARMSQMTQVADATQYLLYQLNTTADHPFTGFLDKYVEIRNNIEGDKVLPSICGGDAAKAQRPYQQRVGRRSKPLL